MRYIGNKTRLLPEISRMLDEHADGDESTFADLFAGTNSVGLHFKPRYSIISNDLLRFSNVMARAEIVANHAPSFRVLAEHGIPDPIAFLNGPVPDGLAGGYMTREYSPAGPAGRMFFTVENALRIDHIRDTIGCWHDDGWIDDMGFFWLLDSLIRAVSSVSNTTGTYAAYLKFWDGASRKPLRLQPVKVSGNGRRNAAYNMDAVRLAKRIRPDVAYVDTPYNGRQYGSYYHLLETVARWDKPPLHGKAGMRDTSGMQSDFSRKSKVADAMDALFSSIHARHVLVSYSTDGILPEDDMLAIIGGHAQGDVDVRRIPYRKYGSRIPTGKPVSELLFHYRPLEA